jgi:hypothetical protein
VGGLSVAAADTEDRIIMNSCATGWGQAWPCHADQKKAQGGGPERPVAEQNDMDWALMDIPGIS